MSSGCFQSIAHTINDELSSSERVHWQGSTVLSIQISLISARSDTHWPRLQPLIDTWAQEFFFSVCELSMSSQMYNSYPCFISTSSYTCIYDQNLVLCFIVFVCTYPSIFLYFLIASIGQSRCTHKVPALIFPASRFLLALRGDLLAFHLDCAKALYKNKLT